MTGTWVALVVSVGFVALLLRAVKQKPEAVETCATCGRVQAKRWMTETIVNRNGETRWLCCEHDALDPWTL
jgi:hypothetical protein